MNQFEEIAKKLIADQNEVAEYCKQLSAQTEKIHGDTSKAKFNAILADLKPLLDVCNELKLSLNIPYRHWDESAESSWLSIENGQLFFHERIPNTGLGYHWYNTSTYYLQNTCEHYGDRGWNHIQGRYHTEDQDRVFDMIVDNWTNETQRFIKEFKREVGKKYCEFQKSIDRAEKDYKQALTRR